MYFCNIAWHTVFRTKCDIPSPTANNTQNDMMQAEAEENRGKPFMNSKS